MILLNPKAAHPKICKKVIHQEMVEHPRDCLIVKIECLLIVGLQLSLKLVSNLVL